MRHAQAERPARLDESDHGEHLIVIQRAGECRHERADTRRSAAEASIFRHAEQLLIGVLPSVTGSIVRGSTLARELILQLPQRLPLQLPAVAGRAPLLVDALPGSHLRGIRRVREMGGGRRRAVSTQADDQNGHRSRPLEAPPLHGVACMSCRSSAVIWT